MAKKKTAPSSGGEQEPTHPPVPGETTPESAPEETASAGPEEEDEEDLTQVAEQSTGANEQLRRMMNNNYIEYASYVIKDRAIPDVDDGLKPVQRRILWEMHRIDDGSFHKVANIVGGTMKFHPHGDASIEGALVYLANKELFIEKQGNFGSIVTGDRAAASRYIEARLSPLGREVLFNDDITELVESYDSRNLEPVRLPIKIPSLLLMGASGLAPGTRTDIMPHNFNELLNAQIAVLRDEPFQLYPDFLQGGIMDASEYEDGNGKITLRARIDIDGRNLIIREIPALTDTQKLLESIDRAINKSKIKIASIHDLTAEEVCIEIVPQRGYDPHRAIQALYKYTDCSISLSLNLMVIRDNKPVRMTVSDVLRRNTEKLLDYLRAELHIEIGKLENIWTNFSSAPLRRSLSRSGSTRGSRAARRRRRSTPRSGPDWNASATSGFRSCSSWRRVSACGPGIRWTRRPVFVSNCLRTASFPIRISKCCSPFRSAASRCSTLNRTARRWRSSTPFSPKRRRI